MVQFLIPALRIEVTLAYLGFAVVLLIANRAQIRYYLPSRWSRASIHERASVVARCAKTTMPARDFRNSGGGSA